MRLVIEGGCMSPLGSFLVLLRIGQRSVELRAQEVFV